MCTIINLLLMKQKERYEDLPVIIDTASGLYVFVVCSEVIIEITSSVWEFSSSPVIPIHGIIKLHVIWTWLILWQCAHPEIAYLGKGKMATVPADIEKEILAISLQLE